MNRLEAVSSGGASVLASRTVQVTEARREPRPTLRTTMIKALAVPTRLSAVKERMELKRESSPCALHAGKHPNCRTPRGGWPEAGAKREELSGEWGSKEWGQRPTLIPLTFIPLTIGHRGQTG